MTSASTYYKIRFLFTSLIVSTGIVFSFTCCGNKTNPLPPIRSPVKAPDKPIVIQKGDSIIVRFANPFYGTGGDWRLRLYRAKKILIPSESGGSRSSDEIRPTAVIPPDRKSDDIPEKTTAAEIQNVELQSAKDDTESQKPKVVVVKPGELKFKAAYPELPKLSLDDFKDIAIPVLDINGKDFKSSAESKEIIYTDPKAIRKDRLQPEAFYYAVRVDDPEGNLSGFSNPVGIMPLSIQVPPQVSGWEVQKNKLVITVKPPSAKTDDINGLYFTAYNIYSSDCKKTPTKPLTARPLEYLPANWSAEGALRLEPVYAADAGVDFISVIFAGRKGEGLIQQVLDEKSVKKLEGACLHLRAELRSGYVPNTTAEVVFEDGRIGKPVKMEMQLDSSWKTFETEYTINPGVKKLQLTIAPGDISAVSLLEIKSVSLTILKISDKPAADSERGKEEKATSSSSADSAGQKDKKQDKEKAAATPDTRQKSPIEAVKDEDKREKQSKEEVKEEFKEGDDLIRNGSFKEFPDLTFKDDAFTFEKEFCYYAVSALKFDANYYESEFSEPVKVFVKDTLPPESVKNLYFLATLDSITLIWSPNKESDLAGYCIYRRSEKEKDFTKITTVPIKATKFTDTPPVKGLKYFYYVVAVDNSPSVNESKPSETIEFIAREDILIDEEE